MRDPRKVIRVSPQTKTRLLQLKETLEFKSIDEVVNHLLDAAQEEWGDDLRGIPPYPMKPSV